MQRRSNRRRNRRIRSRQNNIARKLLSENLEQRMLLATVTAVNPAENAFNVPVGSDISATYDEVITPGSATAANFVVHRTHGPSTSTVSASGMTVTADPSADFIAGEIVHVTATGGIQGTTAGVPKVWQFRAAANSGSGQFDLSPQMPPGGGTGFVVVGDADGDGDLDAIEGNNLLLNDGAGTFSDSGQNVGSGQEKDFVDIDGDGDLDVVSATIWQNDGAGVFTNIGSLAGGSGQAIDVGDVDGDGDIDVATGTGGYNGARLFLNNGSGTFTESGQVLNGGFDQPRALEFGDLDNDGDLDLYVGTWTTANRAWMNDGSGVFTLGFSGPSGSSQDIDLGDFDGDGDLDVLHGNPGGTGTGDLTTRVFFNDGTGQFTQGPAAIDPGRTTWATEIGDMDADGDLDLVIFNRTGNAGNTIWLNDGAGNFSQGATFTFTGEHREYGGDIGDLNGDGSLDVWQATNTLQGGHIWFNVLDEPSVGVTVDSATVAESAGVTTITTTLSAAHTQPVTVDFTFSGTADASDYTASATQIVVPVGSTTGTISITATDDALDEADETIVVDTSITNGTGGGQVTVTITDDDPAPTVALAIDNANLAESGGTATVTATLSAASGQDVTIDLGATGTADGADYELSGTQITIAAGATSGTVTITATDDAVDEPDETVILDITGAVGATEDGTQQVTATIADDDEPPTVSLVVDNANIEEDGGIATFTVTLSAVAVVDNTVDLSVSGTATQDTDYTLSATQVVIPAGSTTGTVTVTSIADVIITEGGETVVLDIAAITGNATEDGTQQATTNIVDDVNGPDVSIAIDNTTIAEGGGIATLTATLANAFSLPVTIDLAVSGTATGGGTDYTASATQIVVPVGSTTGTVTFTAVDDALTEGDETIVVDVAAVINGNEAGDQQVTVTVTDDESPPTVTLAADPAAIAEAGGVSTVTATLAFATTLEVTVDLSVSGTASAGDYTLSGTQIVIAAGSTTGTVTVTAVDDAADDDDETIVLDIAAASNATEDGTQQATVTITDDDDAPPLPPGPTPVANAAAAPVSTVVGYSFAGDIPAAAATDQTFTVHSQQTGQLTGAKTTVSQNGPTAIHTPTDNFRAGELIHATVTSALGPKAAWQFRTEVTGGLGTFTFSGQDLGDPAANEATYGVGPADLDGDGDLDLFFAMGNGSAANNANEVWLNDGTGVFSNTGQALGSGNSRDVQMADVDGDGDMDAVVANIGANAVWLNDGAGNFTLRAFGGNNSQRIRLGDLDADGDLDVFTANNNGANGVYMNDGAGNFTGGASVGTSASFGVDLGDIDGDGDLDAAVANGNTNYVPNQIWLNDGNGNFANSGQNFPALPSTSVGLADLDGDNDLDVVWGYFSGDDVVMSNDGTGVLAAIQSFAPTGTYSRTTDIKFGDVDADGDLDVMVTSQLNRPSIFFLNDGGTLTQGPVLTHPDGGTNTNTAALADIDGDGDIDFIEGTGNSLNTSRRVNFLWTNDNPVINVSLEVDNAAVAEDGGVATITATASAVGAGDITINLDASGTATLTDDYTISGNQIVIPAGSTTGTLVITAVQDALDEADETVVLDIGSVTGATGAGQVTVTITDDDEAPTVALAIDNATLAENGGAATVTATLSAASGQDVVVDLGVTGTADSTDYALSATQITIAAGSTSGTVAITATDDVVDEPDETVILDITGAIGATEDGTQQVTATITDDDLPPTVTLAVDEANIPEDGGVATFTVTMSAPSLTDTTIDLAVSGTATETTDFTISGTQVVIAAGSTSGSVTVTSIADVLITEGGETVVLDIAAIAGNATEDGTQQATTTIVDDVNGPDVTLTVDNTTLAEAGGMATLTLTLANAFSLPITIDLGLTGTATGGGTDYTASGTQVVIPVGETTGTVTITAVDDALIEGDETLVVDITNVVNGNEVDTQQANLTITDDETPPTVTLAVDVTAIAEDAGVATFTATASAASTLDITVGVVISGTATATDDYTASATEIVIPAGSTTGTLLITAVQDTLDDDDETIVVDIDSVTNATEDGTQQATVTITDDDDAPPLPPGPTPPANSVNNPITTVVGYTFDQAVTPGTGTDQTFVVHTSQGGRLVGPATTVTENGPTVQHDPTGNFFPGEYVQVTVTNGITTAGGPVAPRVFEFRTASGGTGNFSESGEVLGEVGTAVQSFDVALGDVDGDGDLDAFMANYGGTPANRVYLNDGTGVFTDSGQLLGNHNSRHPSFGDMDGDGDLDVVVPNDGGQGDRVWINNGNGIFTEGSVFGGLNSEDLELGDVDGDGDLDAVVAVNAGANQVFLNDGSGNMSQGGSFDANNDGTFDIELGDLDGDGDLDAFTVSFYNPHRVWLNNGNGQFSDNGQNGFFAGFRAQRAWTLALGDVDADGDLDAYVGNSDYEDEIWLNEGNGTFVDSGQRLQPGYTTYGRRARDVEFGDFDGDGDLDAFIVHNTFQAPRVWQNDGDGVFTDLTGNSLDRNRNSYGVALGDVNGDGSLDAVVANANNANGADFSLGRVWLNEVLTPTVTFAVDPADIAEAAGASTVTATLSGAFGSDVTIDFTFGGTADASDFTASATQLVIPAGSTSGSIVLTAVDDSVDEPDETIIVDATITNGQGAAGLTVTILDDDEPVVPNVTIAVDSASIPEEAGVANFTLTLSEATTVDVTVDVALSGTAAATDYTVSATQVVIPAGSTSGTVTVTAVQDTEDEQNETVIVDIAAVVGGNEDGDQQATTTITDDDGPASFTVTTFDATSTGFTAQFNANLDANDLNLYDTSAGLGLADVTVVGATSGPVSGSLTVDPGLQMIYFIATGGALGADTYTVTLRSATDGFEDDTARLLDGNGDGTAGDDYSTSFTVAEAPANAVTLSLPDFVRGPGQPVNIPANETGLPLSITNGAGVRNVTASIDYNPALLSITGATVGASMPAGAAVAVDTSTPGTAVVTFTSPADLPEGTNTLVNLTATVPTADADNIYRSKQVLDIHSATVVDTTLPVIDDDGLHVVQFAGDVSGNARINAADASQVAQFAALLIDGFSNAQNADPVVMADVSGNGRVNAADASQVAQFAALLPVDNIPEVPAGVVTSVTFLGPDPKLSIARDINAAVNDTITVPVEIDSIVNLQQPNRLAGAGLVVEYDTNVLTATGVTNGSFITSNPGWSVVPNTSVPGRIIVVAFTSTPVAGQFIDTLVNLEFTVNANAPAGESVINLVAGAGGAFTELLDEDDNFLVLEPAPTNDPTDSVDGLVTIAGAAGPTVSLAVDNAAIAEAGGVATVTATLSAAATADVTVDLGLTGTATNPDDYTASATQITIAAGATSGSVTITAVDDAADEDDETVIVDITGVTGAAEDGDQQVTTTITDDDDPVLPTVSLAVDNADIAEAGGVATVTATLSAAATADITVDLGLSGTATNPDDYTASATQITIATGATSGTVTITAVDDAADEENETVIVDIVGVSAGATEAGDQQVTTTITDDDEAAAANRLGLPQDLAAAANETITVPINISTVELTQGAGNRLAGVGVALRYDTAALTLNGVTNGSFITGNAGWSLVPNTAVAGQVVLVGFTSTPVAGVINDVLANLEFTVNANAPAGPTVINLVPANGAAFTELLDENDRALDLGGAVTNDTTDAVDGIITIAGDTTPTVSLAVDNADIAEAGGVATFTATLSAAATADVIVDLGFTGTATNPDDYTASATQITIAAGATSGSVTATAVDDAIDEENETIIVDIVAVTGANEDGDQQATATITDDDDPVVPTVTLTVDNADIAEAGGVATFTATLSAAATADVTVDLGFTGTATNPDDYTASATQITIATGATSGTVTVTAVDDAADEENETVIVDIVAANGATEDGDQQATTTITDDDDPVVPTVTLTVDNADIAEAGGVATFTATLSAAATADVTVDLGFTGTATNPDDYTASATQITIATGATSGTVTVTAVDDAADEENETVIVDIVAANGATEDGDQQATTTITDDDDPVVPTVTLTVDNADIAEAGGVATFTATLSAAATADVTVDLGFTGTATNPDDYTASATQITIATGATSGTVTVTAVDDAADEENETVIVDIVAANGATEDGDQQATTTITDDDDPVVPTVTLTVDNADIAEAGGVATFTATLSAAATADVTVDLGFTGTATNPDDYTASATQITIATGATSGTVTVTAVDDAADEENETVIVDIVAANGATEDGDQQATTTITDDDDPVVPTVTLTVDNADIAEAGGVATFTATLSAAATADVTVDLGFTGTATNPDDYTASATQITIATGATSGTVTVTAVDDAADEENETVIVDIVAANGATEDGDQQATTTITDDDDPVGPTVTLTVDNADIAEAGGVATFTATLSAAATADVTVDLGFTGTATNPDDYTASATQITIATGATSGTVTVTAVDDAADEENETVIVDIVAANGATEDGDQQATTTITDDDDPVVNNPPVLTDPGTQNMSTTQDTLDVVLNATDPDAGAVLTYSATLESAEYLLDSTIGLNFTGDLFENFGGLGEKWLLADNGTTWYYITPEGTFYEWLGGGVLNRNEVAQLSVATFDDPALLYNATAGATVPAAVTVTGNTLTIDPNDGFVGSFAVNVTVSDGSLTDSQLVQVNVQPNEAPVLENPGNQTLPTTQDTLDVALTATDPMGDTLTLTATVESGEYYLDQTIGLQLGPNGDERNWSGNVDEKWVLNDAGDTWYFITPDGSFYRWLGGNRDILANAELVATLSPATHADLTLLYDAQAGVTVPATIGVAGTTLTIDPNAGFTGIFSVAITATDSGGLTDTQLIRVDVTAAPLAAGSVVLLAEGEGNNDEAAQQQASQVALGFVAEAPINAETQNENGQYQESVDAALEDGDLLDSLIDDLTSDLF